MRRAHQPVEASAFLAEFDLGNLVVPAPAGAPGAGPHDDGTGHEFRMVDGQLLHDGRTERCADQPDGTAADAPHQFGQVIREGLDGPGQRRLAGGEADAAVVENQATVPVVEIGRLEALPIASLGSAAPNPDDVGSGSGLLEIDQGG